MVIPAGFAQVNLFYTGTAAPTGAQNTFGVDHSGLLSAGQVNDAVQDALDTAGWGTGYSSLLTVTKIVVKIGPDLTGQTDEQTVSIPGTQGTAATAPNLAMLVVKSTSLGGRKGRGRMFVPGVLESAVDPAGIISDAVLTPIQGMLEALVTDLATVSVPMVLLHSDSTTPTPVTGLNASGTAATQRRRLRR